MASRFVIDNLFMGNPFRGVVQDPRPWDIGGRLRPTLSSEDERFGGIEKGRNFIDPDVRREWV